MKMTRNAALAVCLLLLTSAANVFGASEYASMSISPGEIVWHPLVSNGGVTLTVSGPKGVSLRQELYSGYSPAIGLKDDFGNALPDGQYSYELVFAPASGLIARRDNTSATATTVEPMVQSGTFRVTAGQFLVPSRAPEAPSARSANAVQDPVGTIVPLDQVIPDDLIVQGSICVGFDCINNESFGFDTIRLKENNTRIKFDDTSSSAGFPANDWQLTANDSASGGANKFSIEDITNARVPFTVTANAPTNSLFIDSSGRVGLRTGTPVLDLHIATSNTPAVRLEQNSSGGFTAQTWDIAGNEANFFVRDVTGGSRLPFRIRPGAPTSSIDIAASGNVGIGTASPSYKLAVNGDVGVGSSLATPLYLRNDGVNAAIVNNIGATLFYNHVGSSGAGLAFKFHTTTTDTGSFVILNNGSVGIGNTAPAYPLQVGTNGTNGNGAYVTVGGVWTNGSSRTFKENIQTLSGEKAFETVRNLTPVTYAYKLDPSERHVGFIAEDVPELVATQDRKHLSPMDIVAVLTKVVQELNKTIDDQKKAIAELSGELATLKSSVSGMKSLNFLGSAHPR